MLKLSPFAPTPFCAPAMEVNGLYFVKAPGDKFLSIYARYKGSCNWTPLHIGLPAIQTLQQVRDADRNISIGSGSYEDAHFYLRSAEGNNMTAAYYVNGDGAAIQAGNTSGYAAVNLQPLGGMLFYRGLEVATKSWVQGAGLFAPISHVGAGGNAHALATGSNAGFMSAADKTKLTGLTQGITVETDPTVPAHVKAITTTDISNWNAKENTANKSTATGLGTSNTLFPTQNAVKAYVDNSITANNANYVPTAQKGVANGVASLGADGKIPNGQLPPLAITETFVVASQVAMLALTQAGTGDIAVRTDLNKSFILTNNTPGQLSSWQELLSPTIANTDQVPEGTNNLYFTQGRARASVSAGSGITYNNATGIVTNASPNLPSNLAVGTRTTTTVAITNSDGTGFTLPIATTTLAGLQSAADKTKLDGLLNYILPIATGSVLGGVKVGSGLTINATTGVLSATNTNMGTVTTVTAGNGMDFSPVTSTGPVTLGTPSPITTSSINEATANSHTHAFEPGGTEQQYISGAGTLTNFPEIPTDTDFVTTNTNQVNLIGDKSWDGIHTFNKDIKAGTGSNQIIVGAGSGSENTLLGKQVGTAFTATALWNVAIGSQALRRMIAGRNNTAVGEVAMDSWLSDSATLFSNNTAVGNSAMVTVTSGTGNAAFGASAGGANYARSRGHANTFLGYGAGHVDLPGNTELGSYNIFIGKRAGYNELGSYKFIVGYDTQLTPPFMSGDMLNKTLTIDATTTIQSLSGGGTRYVVVNNAGTLATTAMPDVNNGTLTLTTTGIANGSQTFSANQASNATFTVNVPGTNLGTSANWGELTSSTGTGTTLQTIGRTVTTDGNEIPATVGLNPTFNTTGATNYPSAVGGGFRYVRAANTTLGSFSMWTGASGSDDIWYKTGLTLGTWNTWVRIASKEWVSAQGYTTNAGTVTSVAATVAGAALNVAGSPITGAGTLGFTWGGTASQYVNGAGGLNNFPAIPAAANNGALTLATSGIATGSATFSANQATNGSFTVSVPGTNIGASLSGTTLTITSSTGSSGNVNLSTIIPELPDLQQVTDLGNTTTNDIHAVGGTGGRSTRMTNGGYQFLRTSSGGYAGGLSLMNSAGTTSIAGTGFYGGAESFTYGYLSANASGGGLHDAAILKFIDGKVGIGISGLLAPTSNHMFEVNGTTLSNDYQIHTKAGSGTIIKNGIAAHSVIKNPVEYNSPSNGAAITGHILIKHAPNANATMFEMCIKMYGYNNNWAGELNITFYQQSASVINAITRVGYLTGNDNTAVTLLADNPDLVRVGFDSSGNLTVALGTVGYNWNSYIRFVIDEIRTSHTGGSNAAWRDGWSIETSNTALTGYTSLVSIPVTRTISNADAKSSFTQQRLWSDGTLRPNTMTFADTRSTNEAPSFYFSGLTNELKQTSVLPGIIGGTYASMLTAQNYGDSSAGMSAGQLAFTRGGLWHRDTATNTTWSSNFKRLAYADELNSGTVTSVNVAGAGALTFTGGPVTSAGVISAGWSGTAAQYVRGDGSLATFPAVSEGTVTSVAIAAPSAFTISGSPITGSGTLTLAGAGTAAQYIRGDGTLAAFPTIPAGTVTSITVGNGLTGTSPITANGTITLGTPGATTLSSTNAVTASSHTHAFTPGGTTAQYITGAGTLATFPTIPDTPSLQEITAIGNTTTTNVAIGTSTTPTRPLEVYGPGGTANNIAQFSANNGFVAIRNNATAASTFAPTIVGQQVGATGMGLYIVGQGLDSYSTGAITLNARNTTGIAAITGGNILNVQNYTTSYFSIAHNGAITVPNLSGGGVQMVTANAAGLLGVATMPTGTVTSVGATVAGAALNVAGAPVTGSGTLAFTWAGTAGQYVNGQGNLVSFPAIPAGTVTSVAIGNGLSGASPITGSGTVTLGTPSAITLSSTNSVTASSHTHAFTPGGTAAQYINGAGTLVTFPTIPGAIDYIQNQVASPQSAGFWVNSNSRIVGNTSIVRSLDLGTTANGLDNGGILNYLGAGGTAITSIQGTYVTGNHGKLSFIAINAGTAAAEVGSFTGTTFRINGLAGTGTRMVTADASGNLGISAIPTGTVTSVAIGNGLSGTTPITGSGTVTLGTPSAITLTSTNSVTASSHTHAFTPGGTTAQYIRGDGSLATFPITAGTVTSVGLTAPTAFTVSGSPVTGSGSLSFTGAGTAAQYIDGTGALQAFPAITATRIRGTASGTFVSGDVTLLAGTNVTVTQSSNNITIAATNTTYTGSTSVTLASGSFQRAALTGDVTAAANSNATSIAANAVTYAKMQDIATQTLIGRGAAGTGDPGAVSIGAGLELSTANVLSSTVQDRWLINAYGYIARNPSTASANGISAGDGTGAAGGIQTSGAFITSSTYTVLPTDHNMIFSVGCGVTLPDPSTCLHRILGVKAYASVTFSGTFIPFDNTTPTPGFTGNTAFRVLQAMNTPSGPRWMILQ